MVFKYNNKKIKICTHVMKILRRYVQEGTDTTEAGGVLIGRENISNSNIIIEYVTEPLPNDIRKRNRFYRKDVGHIEQYQNMFKKNGGIYFYIGEWHTHPENWPNYSITDRNNWKKIWNESEQQSEQFHVIVGRLGVCMWSFDKEPLLILKISWKDVVNSYAKEN